MSAVLVARLKRSSRTGLLACAMVAASVSGGVPAAFADEPNSSAHTEPLSSSQIESAIARDIQRRVDGMRRIEGQGKYVSVNASLNAKGDVLTLNLSVEFLPKWYGAEFEDLLHDLATAAEDQLRDRSSVRAVQFRIGGRDIYDYFPADRPRP